MKNKMLNSINEVFKSTMNNMYKRHKVIKQCIVTSLCCAMVVALVPSNVFASEKGNEKETDMYSQNVTENVNIEGVNYTYEYYYDNNGQRNILITDTANSVSNTLTFNEQNSTFYLDNEKLGEVKTVLEKDSELENSAPQTRLNWKLQGTYHNKITWSRGTTVAVVAGAIAVYLATLGAAGVIAAMGSGSLSVLASNAIGGTLHRTLYRATTGSRVHHKYNWSFVASTGQRFGTYTYQYTL